MDDAGCVWFDGCVECVVRAPAFLNYVGHTNAHNTESKQVGALFYVEEEEGGKRGAQDKHTKCCLSKRLIPLCITNCRAFGVFVCVFCLQSHRAGWQFAELLH